MSLLDLPIPPKPAAFTPNGVPPGITANLSALVANANAIELGAFGDTADADDDCCSDEYSDFIERQEALIAAGQVIVDEAAWQASDVDALLIPWYLNRPIIRPRTIVVHTNGASVEASSQSQVNWGNAAPDNTKAHYSINQPTPQKLVPSNRRAIANSTGSSIEQQYGVADSSYWAIAIETADMGAHRANAEGRNWPTDCGPFLHDHAELIARILAYECIVWDIPPVFQTSFTGTGILSHTDPFPYPFFTIQRGKTCSGLTKKAQLRDELIPRAAQIVAAWTNPEGELDMATIDDLYARLGAQDAVLAAQAAKIAELDAAVAALSTNEGNRYKDLEAKLTGLATNEQNRYTAVQKRDAGLLARVDDQDAQLDRIEAKPGGGGGLPPTYKIVGTLAGTATA